MIQKLRFRFIGVAMLSIGIILVLLMGTVNLANFASVSADADDLLDSLVEGNGTFILDNENAAAEEMAPDGTYEPVVSEDAIPSENRQPSQGVVGAAILGGSTSSMSGETPYESRYFTVILDTKGKLVALNTQNIASVTTREAVAYSKVALKKADTRGYISCYRYRIEPFDGGYMLIFLDRTSALSNAVTFLMASIFVCLFGLITFFLLISILSRRVFEPVADSYRKQKKFITNAGHELKTPLAIIDSCTDVVELENGETKWTSGIHDQVDRLNSMVQELITMAKMDENDIDLEQGTFDLTKACHDLWEPFLLMAEDKGLNLQLNIAEGVTYYGNEKTIRQIISILADNAMKYATTDQPVTFNLTDKSRKIRIFTENGTENVAKGEHPEFFERFYRGDESHSTTVKGYGIGLSMMKTIVLAHGGKVSATSDNGTRVRIQALLPYRYEKRSFTPGFMQVKKDH